MSIAADRDRAARLELMLGRPLQRATLRPPDVASVGAYGGVPGGVPGGVEAAHAALDGIAQLPVWSLDGRETGELVVALERLTAKAAALQARLLAHAARGAGVWDEQAGARVASWTSQGDLAGWLAEALPITRAEATRRVVLARSLDADDHAEIAGAMADGDLARDQAAVIVDAVDRIPAATQVTRDDGGPAAARDLARSHLIGAARTWHVPALRRLGRRILEVVDPQGAETREAARLAAEEAKALERCSFSMAQDAHGSWVGRFVLPELTGAMLRKALTAIANPARDHSSDADGVHESHEAAEAERLRRAPRLRMGEAFAEYVERFPAGALPAASGGSATIVVTAALADLQDALAGGAATLDTGGRLSAGETRRLACTAAIVPMVLDGASQPLDLGRERRLHSKAQRLAMTARDGGCRAVGCDWPPGMCHAHHLRPWSTGGPTTVDDGILLCPRHHRQAHRPGVELALDDDRRLRFDRTS